MGFRFRKSFGKGPFRVTVSKSGVGYSVGTKGFRYTKKAGGGTRTTASIPGTGISYVTETSAKKAGAPASASRIQPTAAQSPSTPVQQRNTSSTAQPSNTSTTLSRHKYCPKCQKEISLDAVKCPHCGKRISGGGADINSKWGIAALIVGLALIGSNPLLAALFLAVAVWLAVKAMKEKKAPPSTSTAPKPMELPTEADRSAEVQAIVNSLHDGTFKETVQELYGDRYTEPEPEAETQEGLAPESGSSSIVGKTHKVTGLQYYKDNLLDLAVENSDYDMSKKEIIDCGMEDEKIWKYEFYPRKAELVPEPDNPHDPNAIKVVVDGRHVGYIKAGSCTHLLKLIKEGRIKGIDCEIGGGPYKTVFEEIDDDTYENVYKLQRDETNLFVHLTVYEEKK